MSENANEPGHGNSVAAWTAVIVAMLGSALVTLGFIIKIDIILYIGTGLTVVSIALGPILAKLGYGVAGKNPSK